VVDSGFLHDSSELLHAFLSWTRTGSAKEQIFGWIISTVILGGVSTLLLRMTRTLGRIVYVRHRQNSLYKDAFGEFFLYYPALVPDLNKNIPRVTRFIIHRGILSAALASQRDANNDRNVLYRGSGIKGESYLQFDMRSPEDRSAKLITVWNFQKRPGAAGRVTCGVMCCINIHREPYGVPILLSETPLSREAAEGGLAILAAPRTLTRTLRQEVYDFLKPFPPSDQEEEFEHGTSPKGPLVQKSGWKRKLRIWLEID
jgi:hypothetical protein